MSHLQYRASDRSLAGAHAGATASDLRLTVAFETSINASEIRTLGSVIWTQGPQTWTQGPQSWTHGPESWTHGPESWTYGSQSRTHRPQGWELGPQSWKLGHESCEMVLQSSRTVLEVCARYFLAGRAHFEFKSEDPQLLTLFVEATAVYGEVSRLVGLVSTPFRQITGECGKASFGRSVQLEGLAICAA